MRGSPFFDGVNQMEASLNGEVVKLPIFYYDGVAIGAVFAARLDALRRAVPDPRISPARLAPGLGAVAVTCFEYRDTDIGPYNELAISVVLNEPHFLPNLPGRALLSGMMHRQMHAWVWHLPVTTEIARAGGVELYNYPKFIAGIEFEDGTTHRVCTLTEGDEHILTLRGERIRTPRSGRFQLFSHLFMDRQPQSSEFAFNALEMGLSMGPGDTFLELGDNHVIAEELRGVLVSRRPIQFQFLAGFEAILYGPEHLTLPLITRFSEEGGVRKLASAS